MPKLKPKHQGSALILTVMVVFIAIVFMLYLFVWEERRVAETEGEARLIARDLARQIERERLQQAIAEDWLTYESKDYGYKFKFPLGWAYLDPEGGAPLGPLNEAAITKAFPHLVVGDFTGKQILQVQALPSSFNNEYISGFIKSMRLDDPENYWKDQTMIDQVVFDRYEYIGKAAYPYNNNQIVYLGQRDIMRYIIRLSPHPLAETIFSTFTFQAPAQTDTALSTEALGFTIDYPSGWQIDSARSTYNEIVFDNGLPGRESVRSEESVDSLVDIKNNFVSKFSSEAIKNVSQLTVAGQAAYRIDTSEFGTSYILFKNGDKLYTITTGGRFPLDSFRFVE